MSARVLVVYAASSGFTARHAADVATEIAEVDGLEVDVKPMAYVASIEPYVAVYLGWSSHSRAGQREMTRFLDRHAAHLAERRIWVVQRQPGLDPVTQSSRGVIRLSRLLVRDGVAAETYAGTVARRRAAAARSAVPSPSRSGNKVMVDSRPVSA